MRRAKARRIAAAAATAALLVLAQCGLEDLSSGIRPELEAGPGTNADATLDAVVDVAPVPDVAPPSDTGNPGQPDTGVHLRYLPDGALECAVYEDHQLYCPTTVDGPLYATTNEVGSPIGTIPWRNAIFDCWLDAGVPHKGGNDTWYRTTGRAPDAQAIRGVTPAYYLTTDSALDENPSAAGLSYCN